MTKVWTLLLSLYLAATVSIARADSVVTLAAVQWPPYATPQLPEQGAVGAVVKAAFAAMGFRADIQFLPWSRAVSLVETQYNFAGYLPEYYSLAMSKRFVFSDPIWSSHLALARRRGSAMRWDSTAGLSAFTVGVVQGRANSIEFDTRVAAGRQRVDPALDDLLNLKKLAAGRVDLAIVDPEVFDYLAAQDPFLGKQLELDPKMMSNSDFFVVFKRSAQGAYWAKIFNEGLKRIDVTAIMRRYIKHYP